MSAKRSLKYLRKMNDADLLEVMKGEIEAYPQPWSQKNFEDCLERGFYSCWVFEKMKKSLGMW